MADMHRYELSESQSEVLRLAGAVGEEVNTLSLKILFNSNNHIECLSKSAELVVEHTPILKAVVDSESHTYYYSEDHTVVKKPVEFMSESCFEEWAEHQAGLSMDRCIECAEIIPIVISDRKEGFFIRLYHAIADGWSAMLLFRLLTGTYKDLLEGRPPVLIDVPRYENFVFGEATYRSSKRGQRDAAFWKELLSDHREGNLMSEDRIGMDFSIVRYSDTYPRGMVEAINRIANTSGRTVQSVLMTAVATSYARMKNVQSFCLGTLLLNRLTEEELETIGNCFTTVPLPIDLNENETFESLNEQISDKLYAMIRRSRTSYSRIMEQAFDEPLPVSLFDVLVNYQDFTSLDLRDTEFKWYAPSRQLETLQISFVVTSNQIEINYDYRPDKINESDIRQLNARLTAVLEDVYENMKKPVSKISQIPEFQKELLEKWNDTDCPYPEHETLYSLFEKQAHIHPEKPALYFSNEKMTYGEFEKKVICLSKILKETGVEPGKIVGVMMDRSFEMMIAIYAVIRCGAAYMPVAVDSPEERLTFMLSDSGSPVLLTQSHLLSGYTYPAKRIDVDTLNLSADTEYTCPLTKPELPAYVIYTSGSTGTPKGVLIAQHSIVDRIHWMNRKFGMNADDVVLQKTPYTFDVSVWELFWWAGYGSSLAILAPEAHKDPEQIIAAVECYHVTKMHFVPSMLSAFLAYAGVLRDGSRLGSLKQVFASGEALMPNHVQKFYQLVSCAELINLYGPTECTVDVSWFCCPHSELSSIPIGKPVDNTKLYVLDEHLQMLPIGAAGELCVAGNLVGIGYLNRPELTAERFVDNPFGSGKLYHTGDLVYWNEKGEIEYLGRMDFQVKLRGQRIELGEIERSMTSIEGLQEAVAAVQNLGTESATLVAYYTGIREFAADELSTALEKRLPHYMIPQVYMRMEVFPKTTSGKTDRKKLPVIPLGQVRQAEGYVIPETELQKRICVAFSKALGISQNEVGLEFDFFRQGGTSLTALLLLTDLFEDYRIQLKDIYLHPTPRKLAESIEGLNTENSEKEDYSSDYRYFNISSEEEPNPGIPDGKDILLTGATGFLGVHILSALLEKYPCTCISCFVRSEEKLRKHWAYMFDNAHFPEDRIRIIKGDLTKEKLGMSDEDYSYCREQIAAVYHCAADVRHFGNWDTSYSINTIGTEHIIELCLAAGAVLHHISTISVNGYVLTTMEKKLSDEFTEDNLFVGQRYRENVYVHSKYLAEKAILEARTHGLKANIYRVGNLLWRSYDGKFQENREAHDFYMLTHSFLNLGVNVKEYADLEVDLTAVDRCAEAITSLAASSLNQTYHIATPNTVTWQDYLNMVSGMDIPVVSMPEFTDLMHRHANDADYGFLFAYFATLENMDAAMFPVGKKRKTVQKLAALGFEWEKPTVEYARFVL